MSDHEIETQTVELPTTDGPMACYEARPGRDVSASGAVVVIQEAFGVNDYIEDVTRRFARAGYHAVAPHLFHRAGGGTAPYDDFAKVIPLYEGLTDDGILVDVDTARAHLHGRGWTDLQIAIVGFCFGGRVTFLTAIDRSLGAAVGFYGGGIVSQRFPQFPPLIQRTDDLRTPWLGLFGAQDESIPMADVEELRGALTTAPVATEVVVYSDAGHGFHCDRRDSYHRESADDGWRRTLEWLEAHLAVPAP
ncbi:MAG: dienelactone hydrolase family protein [Acidimicrobiia bacterium]